MFDLILAQMGLKPDELQKAAHQAMRNMAEGNARLKRIEEKLGITEPLILEGDNGPD